MEPETRETEVSDDWHALCLECGPIDSCPNGRFMEAAARVHARDTGHRTFVAMEVGA